MDYLAVWRILEEMTTELRKKGVTIPAHIMNSLRDAKTMINILKTDPEKQEYAQRVEEYFGNIQSYLISEGQEFGQKYVDKWLKQIDTASRKTAEEEKKETKLIPRMKQQKWIRVAPSAELPLERLEAIAEKSKLSHKLEKDGCFLVYGEENALKDFVKRIATENEMKAEK